MLVRQKQKIFLKKIDKLFFIISVLVIIFLQLSPTMSLLLGLLGAAITGNPYSLSSKSIMKYLLQVSIIGLGFGMNFTKVIDAGKDGFVFTLLTIGFSIGLGFIIGRLLNVDRIISYLISVGTAICGGSAIAAMSQIVDADENDVSVSIGTIFILNAIALFTFPVIGALFHLSQQQFGIWSAIAIHDTSSVVGAASSYGNESLMTATTIKLARALWIIPLAIITSLIFNKKSKAASFPWFILLFVIASMINTYLDLNKQFTESILAISKTGFSLTLFLIGMSISPSKLRSVGFRPLLQGVILWIVVLICSLIIVIRF
jgi:uncharacterized integral membrane protein (TIGR00698 family)